MESHQDDHQFKIQHIRSSMKIQHNDHQFQIK